MTGAAKATQQRTSESTEASAPSRYESRLEMPSTAKPADQPAPDKAASQSSLSGLEPDDRLTTSKEDEDLLDIPAFLRRQAN
jgi:cell division protein FtsZ